MRLPNGCLLLLVSAVAATARAAPPDAADVAARIDRHLRAAWERAGVTPSATVDDATFLRRASLDLIGRIPTVAETRAYLDDRCPDKAAAVINRMLDSGGYAGHFATFWRRVWLPQADTPQFAGLADGFEDWLAARLGKNARYDRLVYELLTTAAAGPATPALARVEAAPPRAFLAANERKPENLAASTARSFLGVNLDCAQCHNHPFARWTRDQFWETAAFFSTPARVEKTGGVRLELAVPGTKRLVRPRLLDGGEPRWPDRLEPDTGRRVLADWLVARGNPYFARNAVNRLWAHVFGSGLVEPLDDLSDENPPSHPELLDELTAAFADSGFDLKFLTKALVLSRAYRLSSVAVGDSVSDEAEPRTFARMAVRGLTGEQLYDSLLVAAGLPADRRDLDPVHAEKARRRFAARFRIDRPASAERSMTQALALINGRLTADLTDPENAPTLVAVADAPFLGTRGKVETLFFATLGRQPTDAELSPLVAHVERGGAAKDPRKALADVFWALLNGSEFNTNH